MTQTAGAAAPEPRWRALRFAAGFLVGLAVIPAVLSGLVLLIFNWPHEPPPKTAMRRIFTSAGAELSRAEATSVVWRRENEVLRQTCRDACDDVEFSQRPARAAEVDGTVADWRPVLKRTEEPAK